MMNIKAINKQKPYKLLDIPSKGSTFALDFELLDVGTKSALCVCGVLLSF